MTQTTYYQPLAANIEYAVFEEEPVELLDQTITQLIPIKSVRPELKGRKIELWTIKNGRIDKSQSPDYNVVRVVQEPGDSQMGSLVLDPTQAGNRYLLRSESASQYIYNANGVNPQWILPFQAQTPEKGATSYF